MSIFFCGDPHGNFTHIVEAVQQHRPEAIVLLGDIQARQPLERELQAISDLTEIWWIHGNHDTDSDTDYDYLFGSALGSLTVTVSRPRASHRCYSAASARYGIEISIGWGRRGSWKLFPRKHARRSKWQGARWWPTLKGFFSLFLMRRRTSAGFSPSGFITGNDWVMASNTAPCA